jgi:hypothetical protein
VLIDGKRRATLPLEAPVAMVAGKEHRIEVTKPGMDPYHYRITCRPGERIQLRLSVQRARGGS